MATVALLTTAGCKSSGSFVWVNEAPASYFKAQPALTIALGDSVSVRVFGQEPLSLRATVRPDGAITMPLIGDVSVAGKSPSLVAKEIEARLVPYVTTPNVLVVLEDMRVRIVVIGEVRRTGSMVLEPGEHSVLAALASAGGLTEFAGESDIYVLRQEPSGIVRIRFLYEDITRGTGPAAAFKLRTGDQLVIE